MPIPPNNTARVDLRFTLGGEACEVVQHWICDSPPVDQTLTDQLAAAVGVWAVSDLLPSFSTDLTLDDVVVSSYLGGGLAFQSINALGAVGGDANESAEPNQVAVVVTWRTIVPDKSGRGRSFFPGISSNKIQLGSDVAPATLSDIQDAADALVGGAFDPDWSLGVWSRVNGVVLPVIGAQARSIVRTQKRRLPRN